MPERCTCGSFLVADAMFCHRCGRPVRPLSNAAELSGSDAAVDQETAAAATSAGLPPQPSPSERLRAAASELPAEIGFQNPAAVRIAAIIAALCTLLGLAPVPQLFNILWKLGTLIAAGFIAVYVYHRRTGDLPSVRGGARMGWMTGMFSFVIALVMFVASIAVLASQGGLAAQIRQQMIAANGPSTELEELLRVLETPTGMAMLITTMLMVLFLLFTALPMIGGALGAKALEKE